jgi:hypothetical protein
LRPGRDGAPHAGGATTTGMVAATALDSRRERCGPSIIGYNHYVANPEHLDQLQQGPGHWNRWRATYLAVPPDLVEANLEGADLCAANLAGANLARAALFRADLRTANLVGADLGAANLVGADLGGADLRGANLDGGEWDETTIWPTGYQPSHPANSSGPPKIIRVERLDEPGANVVRWGLEPLIGAISELLDDTSALSRQLHLDDEQLAAVERYRSILIASLQDPAPDAVVIARTVARLAALVGPTPEDLDSLTDALGETGMDDPAAAAADVVDITAAVSELGHEDAADDQAPVEALQDRVDDLGERAVDPDEAHPLRAAGRAGVATFLEDKLPDVLEKWAQPKTIRAIAVAVTASLSSAAVGAARFGGPLVQYAISALHAIFQAG